MASNTVTVSGMFGNGKTYFSGSPVMIHISGLAWPESSPFNIVRVCVDYGGEEVGYFQSDTGGATSVSFDISSALRAIWIGYEFSSEADMANAALTATSVDGKESVREMRAYTLRIYTEYISSDDGGVFTVTKCTDAEGNTDIPGGQCVYGWMTERERSRIGDESNADVSHMEHTGVRNGDASTKPKGAPERVGKSSITSWVDVQKGYTKSIFYPSEAIPVADDSATSEDGWTGHAPIVLRDSIDYVDFIFVNRRGAVETCSGRMLEAMDIDVEVKKYIRDVGSSFKPSRSVMSIIQSYPRRSWKMSSGYVDREWAEWWVMEFLSSGRWWMKYKGTGDQEASYVPVVIESEKTSVSIYDRVKQDMTHIDFTVTLALEG